MNRIATWELWAEQKCSQRRMVVIAIHVPEINPNSPHGDYQTLVEVDGIAESRSAKGVNSLQSLVIALQLLRIQLETARSEGWQFYFNADDLEPFDLLGAISIRSVTES